MGNVVALSHAEDMEIDPDRLHGLVERFGELDAGEVLLHASDEMIRLLARMDGHYARADTAPIRRDALELAHLAGKVGMCGVSAIAVDVEICAARGDMTGFAATWARLCRVVERALSAHPAPLETPG